MDVFSGEWYYGCSRGDIDASPMEPVRAHPVMGILLNIIYNRYAFPQEPVMNGDMIDLTADDKLFYFNPYSGELSLDFPKAERNCRGGILA